MVSTGLDILSSDQNLQSRIKGNVGYLCHAASVNREMVHGIAVLRRIFGARLLAVFSPQHGIFGSDQDNMIETDHSIHPYFKVKVYSLYSETRVPTDQMLQDIDHLIIDLQDVGSRIYTYINTALLAMEACGKKNIKVWILDRPNPVNGVDLEGNILDPAFRSFVGLYPLPMRHGLTIGEVARSGIEYWGISCEMEVVPMKGWQRTMAFEDTELPWVLPSPNMPSVDTAFLYPGTVLVEGTELSEGRGTTKSLEIIGHPSIEPFGLADRLNSLFKKYDLNGFILRPLYFKPVYQKQADRECGGFQIHVTDRHKLRAWKMLQVIFRELHHEIGPVFSWKLPPYEYEHEKMPIDILNGTNRLRQWVEKNGSYEELLLMEQEGMNAFNEQRENIFLY